MVLSAIQAMVATSTPPSILMFVNSITLSILAPVNSIALSIPSFGGTVLGHGRGKQCCHQYNTCTDYYFFHNDFLLFSELDFRPMYWLRRIKIHLVYKNMEAIDEMRG
jgi:hypothetical protein